MNFFLLLITLTICLQANFSSAETINYSYDDLDRLRSTEYVNNNRIIQDYDEIGNISIRSSYTYNSLRLRYEKSPDCISGTNYNNSTIKCESNPTCSSGVYNSALDQCVSNGSYSATTSYTCPSGGTLSGTTCNVSGSYAATISGGGVFNLPLRYCQVYNNFKSTCTSYISGYWASQSFTGSKSASMCSSYNVRGSCTSSVTVYYSPTPFAGSVTAQSLAPLAGTGVDIYSDDLCLGVNTRTGSCINYLTAYITKTPGTYGGTYTCPLGGTLSGTTCNTSSTYAATPNYTCPSGGTLSGTMCNTTTSLNASCTVGILDIASDKCVSNPTCSIGTLDISLGICWSY